MVSEYISQQKALVDELESSFVRGNHKLTVVDIQQDYINDDRICLTSLVFIPKIISEKIIQKIIKPLKEIDPVHYFYPSESMHLTIKNIRTISEPPLFTQSDILKVNELFKKTVSEFPMFDFYIEDVLLFPTSLSVMAYSDSIFQKLFLALDRGLKEIGVPDNKKYLSDSVFFGNITVCRFTKSPSQRFLNAVKNMRNLKIGKLRVESINLITCNVVCYPKSRRIIEEYKLK